MLTRRSLLASAALALAFAAPLSAETRLPVVASFSILGDMVAQIGGDRIDLTTLVGPDADAHMFQPAPADARALSQAGLVVMNGLDFDTWMIRLIEAGGYKGPVVTTAEGIEAIAFGDDQDDHGHDDDHKHDHGKKDAHGHAHDHGKKDDHAGHDHGAFDPHAWQDVRLAMTYARNIAAGLEAADPAGAQTYRAGLETYLAELDALDAEIRTTLSAIPPERRRVVTAHDSFGYFARAYGVEFLSLQGLSTNSEASARDVAAMIRQIKDQGITAVFVENVSDDRLLQQITSETGASIGGTLFSDALSMPVGPAPTYAAMMRHNAQQLLTALSGTN
jgi:zinc/manganese transport system substrate-binding protein